jgi:hypothetical protein
MMTLTWIMVGHLALMAAWLLVHLGRVVLGRAPLFPPMVMTKAERRAAAARDRAIAEAEQAKADDYAAKAAAHRNALRDGSDDPEADWYLAEQYAGNQRVCQANARDWQATADQIEKTLREEMIAALGAGIRDLIRRPARKGGDAA